MDFIKITLVILVCIVVTTCLPIYEKSISFMITIIACIIIIVKILDIMTPVIITVKSIFAENTDYDFGIIFKCMGVSILTGFTADLALDSGNKTLANQMVLTGKIAIISLALPLFVQILELIGMLII